LRRRAAAPDRARILHSGIRTSWRALARLRTSPGALCRAINTPRRSRPRAS
jgi:hypothetical protein